MALYLLKAMNYSGKGKILFLSQNTETEYLRDFILIGLKEALGGDKVIDYPQLPFIYKDYPLDIHWLYGYGMTYTKILDNVYVDRSDLREKIKNKYFELIIYAEIHKSTIPLYELELIKSIYDSIKIAYLYAEEQEHSFVSYNLENLFIREYHLHHASSC
jgi:hypothetical protein